MIADVLETLKLLELFQARIKKIMQTDEEVGKVAAAVPVIICILTSFLKYFVSCVSNCFRKIMTNSVILFISL